MNKKTNIKPRRHLLNLAVLAALGSGALASAPASAADLYWDEWTCGSAPWDSITYSFFGSTIHVPCWRTTPGGWDATNFQPQNGDNVLIQANNNSQMVVDYSNTAYPSAVLNRLEISGGVFTTTLLQTKDQLEALAEYVDSNGAGGIGVFTQSGGTNTTGGLVVADAGIYNLSGTGILSAQISENIGTSGTGAFNQSGGTNTTDLLALGGINGSNGTYNLSGTGVLSANFEIIGFSGTGTFTQSGGANTVNALVLGENASGGGVFGGVGNGTYNLSGTGILSASYEVIGKYGTGTFNQTGGTHTTEYLAIGIANGSNGTYNLSAGNLSANWKEEIGVDGNGTFNQSGGTNMTISLYTGSAGTYNYSGGALTAGSIVNNGTFNQSGTTTVTANVANNGAYNLSGAGVNTVAGDFTNNASGTVKTTNTTASFTGTFTNLGAYISDPSDNYFTDLIVGATGYLVGGTGDNFFISNNFTNNSENALWNTQNARLVFDTGTDSLHDFVLGGFASTAPFSWGMIELAAGNTLNLFGMSFYVDTLILGSGADLNLDGITLHYRHLQNNGGTIDNLNGGQLIAWGSSPPVATAVPEPGTYAMLLAGLGLMGFMGRKRKDGNGMAA